MLGGFVPEEAGAAVAKMIAIAANSLQMAKVHSAGSSLFFFTVVTFFSLKPYSPFTLVNPHQFSFRHRAVW